MCYLKKLHIQRDAFQKLNVTMWDFPINNIHEKFLHSDWLRAVQFLGNTVPKKEIQCQKRKFSANFFRF